MGTEVERKFLVQSDQWRAGAEGEIYRQGYLAADPDRTVRVRVAGSRGTLTVKGRAAGLARAEFEYEIPVRDADEMLDTLCLRPLVEKVRYRVPYAGRTWEVDEQQPAQPAAQAQPAAAAPARVGMLEDEGFSG